jgi:4-amino-4-deoxy-L-arabinose transferase-like glycosyltransferase
LPVPVPRYFFQGIDSQLAEAGYTAYLMGEFNDTGFYSYYLVGLLVKTPVPVLFLCALAWFRGGRPTRREVPMVATAALLLLFFSISRHKNIGLRYVLFLEPMMAIWIGRLLTDQAGTEQSSADLNPKRKRGINMAFPRFRIGPVIALAGACLVTITLTSWPHYLPYFNWLSGGPDNGHRWLLDSNLDWGQDLILLQRYMEQERIEQIDLAYFGRVPPAAYGIRHRTLRAGETPVNRHVAISANLLWGLMYIVNGDLNYWPDDPDSYRAFRDLRPKAILGHSIYVFDVRLDR